MADGEVVVLFLADVPDQIRLLTIDGKIKMGFRDDSDVEIAIPVATDLVLFDDNMGINFNDNDGEADARDTIVRNDPGGSFVDEGYFIGMTLEVSGATNTANNGVYTVAGVEESKLILIDTDELVGEAADMSAMVLASTVQAVPGVIEITGDLASPGNGEAVDVAVLNANGVSHVDVAYRPGTNLNLDYGSILDDGDPEISATFTTAASPGTSTPITFEPIPVPVETLVINGVSLEIVGIALDETATWADLNGTTTATIGLGRAAASVAIVQIGGRVLEENTEYILSGDGLSVSLTPQGDAPGDDDLVVVTYVPVIDSGDPDELIELLEARSIKRFRYTITGGPVTWEPGTFEVVFEEGTFAHLDGTMNVQEVETFTVLGPTAVLADPPEGGSVLISTLNEREYLDVTLRPSGVMDAEIDAAVVPGAPLFDGAVGTATIRGPPTQVALFIADASHLVNFADDGDADTITRLDGGSWIEDGFAAGMTIKVSNAANPTNDGDYEISGISETTITLSDDDDLQMDSENDDSARIEITPAEDGSKTFRFEFDGAFELGQVTLTFAADSFRDDAGLANTAQTLVFTVTGSTADLAGPGAGTVVGNTLFLNGAFIDVVFVPASGNDIDPNTLIDGQPELDVTLSSGEKLVLLDDPTQPVEFEGTNIYRYAFDANVLPSELPAGPVTVVFLDGGFADLQGISNVEETETFVIDTATARLVNLSEGAIYSATPGVVDGDLELEDLPAEDLNNPLASFFVDANGRYFEIELTPTSVPVQQAATALVTDLEADGIALELVATAVVSVTVNNEPLGASEFTLGEDSQTVTFSDGVFDDIEDLNADIVVTYRTDAVPAGADLLEAGDLTVEMLDRAGDSLGLISITGVERVLDDDSAETNRFRFFFATPTLNVLGSEFDVDLSAPIQVVVKLAQGAWQDAAGNDSVEMVESFEVRRAAKTFFIEVAGGVKLDAAGLLPDFDGDGEPDPIFDIRGFAVFEAVQTPTGARFSLDFGGTFKVVYLGNIASVAGKFIFDTSVPTFSDVANGIEFSGNTITRDSGN